MTTCAICDDDATHDTDPFSDYGRALCRRCWQRETNPRRGLQARGPDWAERNPEAADMGAQRHRSYRLQGRTSSGGRL